MSRIQNAIGQIEDGFIAEAEIDSAKACFRVQRRNRVIRLGGMAACICLAVCLGFPFLFSGKSGKNEAECPERGQPEQDAALSLGETVNSPLGSLTFVSCQNQTVTFRLVKTTTDPVHFSFRAIRGAGAATGKDDVDSATQAESLFATTDKAFDPSLSPDGTILEGALLLRVNGTPADEMPTDVGDYTVEVDFSALYGEDTIVSSRFAVTGFGVTFCLPNT